MRTTVTLDPDVAALLQRHVRERGVPFKVAVNDAIRAGLAPAVKLGDDELVPARALGLHPEVAWDKALGLASQLEDEETARKLSLAK